MDFDIKTFVMGLLTGLTFGLGIADLVDKDLSQFMSGLGSVLGGIGAITAAVIAYRAYKKWHQQHDYVLVQGIVSEIEVLNRRLKDYVMKIIESYSKREININNTTSVKMFMFSYKTDLDEMESKYRRMTEFLPKSHRYHTSILACLSECKNEFNYVMLEATHPAVRTENEDFMDLFTKAENLLVNLNVFIEMVRNDSVTVFKN